MGSSYARKNDAGYGNRLTALGFSRIRVGRRYKLPIRWLRDEDVSVLQSHGQDLKFKCIAKFPEYAIFENSFGNRTCFRYFELATILHEEGAK